MEIAWCFFNRMECNCATFANPCFSPLLILAYIGILLLSFTSTLSSSSTTSTTSTGASGPGGPEFATFAEETKAKHGVEFHTSLKDLPAAPDGVKRLALISGRTADNPRLLKEAIDVAGCSVIYLEKPGAPTVQELADMRDYAKSKGATVLMGCKYTCWLVEMDGWIDQLLFSFVF